MIRTCIKAWLSSNFGQIPPLPTKIAALERLKYRCLHIFSIALDPNLFKLSGNEDIHTILDEREFRSDLTSIYLSIRICTGENVVSTYSSLISYLLVLR